MKLYVASMFISTIEVKEKISVLPRCTLCLGVKNTFFSTPRHREHEEYHREEKDWSLRSSHFLIKISVKPQRPLCLGIKHIFFQHRDTESTENTTENVFREKNRNRISPTICKGLKRKSQ
jgi:hypothetical protein